jgi:hypothetical protein
MGAFLFKKVRREYVTKDAVTGKDIKQLVLLSGVDNGRVVKLQSESISTGTLADVKAHTAYIEVEPGFEKRFTGFGPMAEKVAALKPNDKVTIYGKLLRNGGLRVEEIHPVVPAAA